MDFENLEQPLVFRIIAGRGRRTSPRTASVYSTNSGVIRSPRPALGDLRDVFAAQLYLFSKKRFVSFKQFNAKSQTGAYRGLFQRRETARKIVEPRQRAYPVSYPRLVFYKFAANPKNLPGFSFARARAVTFLALPAASRALWRGRPSCRFSLPHI